MTAKFTQLKYIFISVIHDFKFTRLRYIIKIYIYIFIKVLFIIYLVWLLNSPV